MEHIQAALAAAIKDAFDIDLSPELTRPDEQFGDFATNVALQLAGRTKQAPRAVAETLAVILKDRLGDGVRDITIAGPGFINISLSDQAIIMAAQEAATASSHKYAGKTVVVEYSDPNPFKPLHAGHLYTTLVGDMVARLVERAGAATVRLNFGGDVGLHVGKSMWAIVRHLGGEFPEKLAAISEADRPQWLGERYVEGNNAYEDGSEADKQAIIDCNRRVYALHQADDHESAFAHIYWTCRQWSYEYFGTLYQQLRVAPFERYIPESEVTQRGVDTVRSQLQKGVFSESDGAVVFVGEPFGLHTRVFINSAGLPTYETKDVGLSLTKWDDYHFDESIIITAAEQLQYMQVVIKAIEQFAPEPATRTRHLTHGTVKLQGGVKMSSRKGNIVSALAILEAARQAGAASGTNPDESTILAAVKYAFAKNRIGGDIVYDPAESIALEGNSGPYLQYAHARARGIIGKSTVDADSSLTTLIAGERSLARKLSEYPTVLNRAINDLLPHHICTYLYELAQTFNRFYEGNLVVGDTREAQRLHLVTLYADILKDGLGLLGIDAPDRM
jgi:arginyl-tRNA synthetase